MIAIINKCGACSHREVCMLRDSYKRLCESMENEFNDAVEKLSIDANNITYQKPICKFYSHVEAVQR